MPRLLPASCACSRDPGSRASVSRVGSRCQSSRAAVSNRRSPPPSSRCPYPPSWEWPAAASVVLARADPYRSEDSHSRENPREERSRTGSRPWPCRSSILRRRRRTRRRTLRARQRSPRAAIRPKARPARDRTGRRGCRFDRVTPEQSAREAASRPVDPSPPAHGGRRSPSDPCRLRASRRRRSGHGRRPSRTQCLCPCARQRIAPADRRPVTQ